MLCRLLGWVLITFEHSVLGEKARLSLALSNHIQTMDHGPKYEHRVGKNDKQIKCNMKQWENVSEVNIFYRLAKYIFN